MPEGAATAPQLAKTRTHHLPSRGQVNLVVRHFVMRSELRLLRVKVDFNRRKDLTAQRAGIQQASKQVNSVEHIRRIDAMRPRRRRREIPIGLRGGSHCGCIIPLCALRDGAIAVKCLETSDCLTAQQSLQATQIRTSTYRGCVSRAAFLLPSGQRRDQAPG